MFCKNCGQEIADNAAVCVNCGVATQTAPVAGAKNKVVAGVLGLLLGTLGIHNFYLGYKNKGLIQLLVSLLLSWTVVAPLVIWVWTIIESVQIFLGKIDDADGNPLV